MATDSVARAIALAGLANGGGGSVGPKVLKAPLVRKVLKVILVPLVLPDLKVHKALSVRPVQLVLLAHKALRETPARAVVV